jgi:hypothetical protein
VIIFLFTRLKERCMKIPHLEFDQAPLEKKLTNQKSYKVGGLRKRKVYELFKKTRTRSSMDARSQTEAQRGNVADVVWGMEKKATVTD